MRDPAPDGVGFLSATAVATARKCLMVLTGLGGEPGRNRTFNLQIKSLLLCQLSYGPVEDEVRS